MASADGKVLLDQCGGDLVDKFAPHKCVVQRNEDGREMDRRMDINTSPCPSTGELGGSAGRCRGNGLRLEEK